jgi:hypothetical protein
MTQDPADSTVRTPSKRRLLAAGGGLLATGVLAGCTGGLGTHPGTGEDAPAGTEAMPARLRLTAVAQPDCEVADPIVYADLSSAERRLVDTALEAGEYAVPTEDTPPAYDEFRSRVEARRDTCGELVVYLGQAETVYRVTLVNGDHVVASARRTPERGSDG